MCVYTYICVCACVGVCVCMYVHMYVCMYVYTYVFICNKIHIIDMFIDIYTYRCSADELPPRSARTTAGCGCKAFFRASFSCATWCDVAAAQELHEHACGRAASVAHSTWPLVLALSSVVASFWLKSPARTGNALGLLLDIRTPTKTGNGLFCPRLSTILVCPSFLSLNSSAPSHSSDGLITIGRHWSPQQRCAVAGTHPSPRGMSTVHDKIICARTPRILITECSMQYPCYPVRGPKGLCALTSGLAHEEQIATNFVSRRGKAEEKG